MPDYPYNPGTGSNPPPPGSNHTPVKTPCELAREAAQKANELLNKHKFKEKLQQMAEGMRNKTTEEWVGLGININTGQYETTPIIPGREGGVTYNNADYPHLNIIANMHLIPQI